MIFRDYASRLSIDDSHSVVCEVMGILCCATQRVSHERKPFEAYTSERLTELSTLTNNSVLSNLSPKGFSCCTTPLYHIFLYAVDHTQEDIVIRTGQDLMMK